MSRRGENIRKRKDGRWEARYIKGRKNNGKIIYGSIYAQTYKEVKEKLHICLENNITTIKQTQQLKFNEIVKQWLNYKKSFIKDSTYNKYLNTYEKYIKDYMFSYYINQLTSNHIQTFILELSKKTNYRTNKQLSLSTVRVVVYIIKSVFSFASKQGLITPVHIDIDIPRLEKKQVHVLQKQEQIILEKYCMNQLNIYTLSILFCLYTGVRIGELCALKWNHIDFNNRLIIIDQTVQRIQNKHENNISKTYLSVTRPKTVNSLRKIPITTNLYTILTEYYNQNYIKKDTYIFNNQFNTPIDPRRIQKHFKMILSKLNLTSITFHGLRHTFATRCIELGMDIKTLSEILGHSNVATTMSIYVHSTDSQKREQMELLSKM